MAVNNLVKKIQDIMRKDSGVDGDAQRIGQMVWMFFLKIYDAKEEDWALDEPHFESIIPEPLRWRNWARHKDEDGKEMVCMTGDELLSFVNNVLFPVLKGENAKIKHKRVTDQLDEQQNPIVEDEVLDVKGIKVDRNTPRYKAIVHEVFSEALNYMKNGQYLREVVNIIDDVDFYDTDESHAFGDLYENILKDLQSAGHAGEFYTPRALTDFIIQQLNPRIGEVVGDFAMGTGGFLISALRHLEPQCLTNEDFEAYQQSVVGQEWKPLPYLLGVTNVMMHDIKSPNLRHMDSLGVQMSTYRESGKVDVIAMNPPYGGATNEATKLNFKEAYRSSETADLFIVLIMERLAQSGRAGVIVPDGFLFGNDNAKQNIKQRLLKEFNLHTIIRLPGSIFNPYTSIATNILFFDNQKAEDAQGDYCTARTWFYRLDMPDGYKHFSKTKPMKLEHAQPIADWWTDRKEIVSEDGTDEKSRSFTPSELEAMGLNFDQCKFPKETEEILEPGELLRQYHEKRSALDKKIDETLNEIQKLLGVEI